REVGDMLDEIQEGLLAPLDVVEQADDGLLGRLRLEQLAESPRDLVRRSGGTGLPEHDFERASGDVVRQDVCPADLLDDLDDGPVRDALAVRETTAVHDRRLVERAQE